MIIQRLLGIKTKEKNKKIKIYFLWIPIWKVVIKNTKIKIYFCGLRILNVAKPIGTICTNNNLPMKDDEYLQLKAFEIWNQRKDCFYE